MATMIDPRRLRDRAAALVPQRTSVDAGHQRTRAFTAARRHSFMVRALRTVLPVLALGILAVYGATTWRIATLRTAGIKLEEIRISNDHLVMASPTYAGYGKDGSRHNVRAKSAETDLMSQKRVKLTAIEGDIVQSSGTTIDLKAVRGTFEQDNGVLELHEQIDVRSSDGMTAKLTAATVYTKESRIVSNEPVSADMPSARIRAQRMELDIKQRLAAFVGDVAVRMTPQQATAKPSAEAPTAAVGTGAPANGVPATVPVKKERAASSALGPSFSSGEPVDVTADRLDVDDNKHIARFRTNVVARQGTSTLTAPELDAEYAGSAAVPGQKSKAAGEAKASTPADQAAASRLTNLKARGGIVMTREGGDQATATTLHYDAEEQRTTLAGPVVITSGTDRRATSNAEIEHKTDRLMLVGAVVLTQARNVLKGERLAVDRANGRTRLDSPVGTGRISALLHRGEEGQARKSAAGGDARESGAFGAFRSDPNQPVDIDAATLDFDDARRSANFAGNVVAKQGDFIIRTPNLAAFFTGQASLMAMPAAKGSEPSTPATLKKIEARGGVVVTGTDGQKVTGDWADFDPQANFVTVGGRVVASQGKNIVEGTKLVMDLTTGRTRFEIDAPQGVKPVQSPEASAVPCVQGQNCTSRRRIRAVFYPKDAKQLAKQRTSRDKSAPATTSAPAAGTGQSAWQSETTKAPPAGAQR